jgi:hypothetical protein
MSAKRIHSMEVNLSSKVRSSQSSNVITGTEPPPGRDRKIITGTEPPPGGDRKIITGTEPPFGRDPKSIPGTEPLSGKDRKSISGSEFLAIMGFKNITGSESLDSLGSINITGTEFLTSMGFKDITGTESISSLDTTFITGSEFLSKIGFKNNIGSETNIDSNSHNTTDIQVPITPGGPDFVRRPGLPIFKVKSNGRTYLRIQEPYRDENGQSRNRNYKNVGKVDPKTGKNIYYPKFIESVLGTDNEPADLVDQNFFSIHDYCETITKHFGIYHLLDHICDSIGLKDALICALPGRWESILDIAKYFAVSGEPAMYCDFWLQKTSLNYEKKISSQRMSELILSISDSEKIEFYTKWSKNVREHEYYALDVSSISSYSELIGDVDWGYNRDGENLPQINICMLTGEKTRIPIFPMTYNGAIKDVSMLVSMLSVSSGINIDKISIVTDKGLPSKNNIDHMLNAKEYVRFLVALPFTMKLAKNQVELVRDIIDCTKRTIDIGDTTLKGIIQTIMWDSSHKLNVHIFHDVIASVTARNKLQKNLVDMREQILSGKIKLDKKKSILQFI